MHCLIYFCSTAEVSLHKSRAHPQTELVSQTKAPYRNEKKLICWQKIVSCRSHWNRLNRKHKNWVMGVISCRCIRCKITSVTIWHIIINISKRTHAMPGSKRKRDVHVKTEQNNAMGKNTPPLVRKARSAADWVETVCANQQLQRLPLLFFKAACNINSARGTLQIAEQNVLSPVL